MIKNSVPFLFTPSYAPDIDRAKWLRKSIERFYNGEATHIFAIPKHDRRLFINNLGSNNIEYIDQEELVDPIFYPKPIYKIIKKIAPSQVWRFEKSGGRPGWIIQQIAKLASPKIIKDNPIVFLDSDVFFIRDFGANTLNLENQSRTLIRITPRDEAAKHRKRIERARNFLALPSGATEHNYMGSPVIWHPDWALQLHSHIENVHNKYWQQALFDARYISEYSLYGIFVEEVIKPKRITINETPYYHIVWDRESFERFKVGVFDKAAAPESKICVIVQSNLDISVTEYEHLLNKIISR